MRRLIALQVSNLLGAAANSAVLVLVPWIVLDFSGSSTWAGVVIGAAGVATVVAAPFVGAVVERFGRRRVSAVADVLSAVSVAGFPVAAALDQLTVATAAALAVLGAVADPAGYTARKALIAPVGRAAGRSLPAVNGLHEAVMASGWVLGPAAGSLLIAGAGPLAAMWGMAVVLLLAAAAVLLVGRPKPAGTGPAARAPLRLLGSSLQGWRALRGDRGLWTLALVFVVLAGFYLPLESVVLSRHFKDAGDPAALGLVLSAVSAGVVAGSLAYPWLARRLRARTVVLAGVGGTAAAIAAMALLPPPLPFAGLGLVLGLAYGPIAPLQNHLVQERVPQALQSQVFGLQLSLFTVASPVGAGLLGVLVDAAGVRAAVVVAAVVFLATALVAALSRGLREVESGTSRTGPAVGLST